MNLNGTIRRLRRAKGLTQEQVAQALGVSGPAVNKWERGACCPDLALLAPLARLLDTDLNTLLSFREELTGAEIAAFTEELYTLAQSGGIDAAFLRAEELLHRWPGCDRLTISLAMTLNGLFFTLGVAEPEPYERRLEPLYRALADSEEPDIRDQALHLLIGRHMRREEYAAAEELLSALSDRWPHRDALQAGLLRRTGRGEEAAELWEWSVMPSFPVSPPPDGSNRPRQRGTRRPPCLPCGICWRRSTAPGTAGGSIPTFYPVRRWPSGPFCCPACCWSSSGSPNWLSSRTSRNFRPC